MTDESQNRHHEFPVGFLWGAATAAYQIEGAVDEDGRGPSIWDVFAHEDGRIAGGDHGDVACDHYHRWPEDLDLLSALGVGAYRFSMAWSRVLPDGTGAVNQPGLDFYDRLVDALLERGIMPVPTLYHWDLPQKLEEAGGWRSRQTADAFAAYVAVVVDRLGDRIPMWITLNEPWVAAFVGHALGRHAPGRRNMYEALQASHHLLLAHAQALPVLRATGRSVGITLNVTDVVPATNAPEDAAAAALADEQVNGWFLDPLLGGHYPERMVAVYGSDFDDVLEPGDLHAISAPIDFLGINYYTRTHIAARPPAPTGSEPMDTLPYRSVLPDGVPVTAMAWPVEPDGLRDFVLRLHRDHPALPVYVTENGSAWDDRIAADGSVDDPERSDYLVRHLAALAEAMEAGADVRGYFAWSLLDNFEWAEGYAKRFGLVRVDYETLERTPKRSFDRYGQIVLANALHAPGPR